MYQLDLPVSSIPKIGPKYKVLLKKLEIQTIGDLLYHFPFRYDDFSNIKKIVQIWLSTSFSGGKRHKRRIRQIEEQ